MYGQTPGIADTGDIVYNHHSGETWVVAFVDHRKYLAWMGWPCGLADLADCTLIKKATEQERLELIHALAIMQEPDPRRAWAREYIERNGFT